VKRAAQAAGIPLLQPEKARHPAFLDQLAAWQPDLVVVAAYGQILPPPILALPQFGCLNVHTSLLPKYRGAAPIQWAIINGETVTGVTIMKMDAGLDTGDILTQEQTPIAEVDDSQTLHDRLATLGARLLTRTIPDYLAGKVQPVPQPAEGATHAPKIKKEDGRMDWTQSARCLWNRVRGLIPWPGAFSHFTSGNHRWLLKIWRATPEPLDGPPGVVLAADQSGIVVGCGAGSLRLLELQREGGKRLGVAAFLAGCPVRPGQTLQ
jgi:methionyl-tRNA formyltransferase